MFVVERLRVIQGKILLQSVAQSRARRNRHVGLAKFCGWLRRRQIFLDAFMNRRPEFMWTAENALAEEPSITKNRLTELERTAQTR